MNAKDFFDLVSQMRNAQKNYFRTKAVDYLAESKRLEKAVDSEISRVNNLLAKKQTLFGD